MNHLSLLSPSSSTAALVVFWIVLVQAPLARAQEESADASAADGSAEDGQPRVRVEERTDVDGQRRSGFYSEGARVQFLVGADGAWSVSRESPPMRATFTLRQDQRSQAAPSVVEGGLARQAGSISEWWLETSRGIEHVMNVDAKDAPSEITVTIDVDGLVAVLADEQAVSLVDGDGAEQLRYSGLYVWDLFHRRQTAWFDVTDSGIAIHVEPDADALGPFTIDPLVSTPTSTLALASGDWGRAVATGYFDSDTFVDLLVGQPDYASGQTGEGRANIVWGTASAPAFPLGTPFEPNVVNAGCGRAVAAADVDGDGDVDVLLGCAGAGLNGGRGGILVFRNSGSGAFPGYPSNPDLIFYHSSSTFTTELAIVADDIDGDGASEIFASARQDGSGSRPALQMFRYASGAQPVQSVALNAAATSTTVALATVRLQNSEHAIATAFDVSAGSRTIIAIDDSGTGGTVVLNMSSAHGLVVGQRITISGANIGGATYNGTYTVAQVQSSTQVRTGEADPGSDNDPPTTSGTMTPSAAAQIQIFRLDSATGRLKDAAGEILKVPTTALAFNSASFSATLTAGDTDGDSVFDLMLGLPLQGNTMRLFESVSNTNVWAPAVSMTGQGGRLGSMLLSADFNNDRHADALVCDSLESSSRGRCRVFGGSPVGLNPFMERFTKTNGGTGFTGATGEGVGQMFAYSAAADLYKDSAADVVLARPTVHAVSMFDGDASSLKATDYNVIPGAAGAGLGGDSFAVADINQDGIDDLVVGVVSLNRIEIFKGTSPGTPMSTQPDWVITSATNGEFGRAVAVGRFRGPTMPPSIAVSDPEFSATRNIATITDGTGAGGPVDVTTTAAHGFVPGDFITISGANVIGATYNNVNYTVSQVLSVTRFVTTQTDPGGDDDPTVTNNGTVTSSGNGRVWIFDALTNGLPSATTTAGASDHISADTAGTGMGLALANCGRLVDTVGDCLAVGHKADSGVGGAVTVWSSSGGSGGLNNAVTAVRVGANTGHDTVCGDSFGAFLANAGVADNSDGLGRDDLLVGAPRCGTNNEGKAYLYSFSSTFGPVLVLKWNFEVNQDLAGLGPVAGLGDVTGDGIADFAVGAPLMDNYNYNPVVVDAGRVYVFKGASGTPSPAQVVSMSTSFSSHCGTSIAGGVDINRDGFKDMIVGEPSYDNGLTDQGRVRVFFGKPGTMDIVPARNGTITGGGAGYAMGTAVAVGNLDGRADGSDSGGDIYGDVIIGVPGFSSGGKAVIRVGEW